MVNHRSLTKKKKSKRNGFYEKVNYDIWVCDLYLTGYDMKKKIL